MDLTDSVAVVTGASSGLGTHFSTSLIDRGAQVYGLARSADKLEAIRASLGEAFHPIECDVREEDSVANAFDTVRDDGGRIELLINNAGLGQFGPIHDLDVGT